MKRSSPTLHDFHCWKQTNLKAKTSFRGRQVQHVSVIGWISRILVIVGGLNWGLIGVANYNAVAAIFGEGTMASKVVYSLVGLAAIWELVRLVTREPVATGAD